jgi:oligopeptide/dipeptide ABC transporter ATP-binding protein
MGIERPDQVILKAENLSKRFAVKSPSLFGRVTSEVLAVDNVSLQLKAGETLALVGESGCGKSTLAKIFATLLKSDSGIISFGKTVIGNAGSQELRDVRKKLQLVFQDPFASLNPRLSIRDILTEPLKIHGSLPREDFHKAAVDVLAAVGLEASDLLKYPHQFSGGQRQRIAIARALISNPELIIADEPLSALDVSVQSQIINLLMRLKQDRNLTYLIISHNLPVVSHMADRVAVMYLGAVVESGPVESIFTSPQHPYTRLLLSSAPKLSAKKRSDRRSQSKEKPLGHLEKTGCPFHERCPKTQEICRNNRPNIENVRGITYDHTVACHFPDND